MRELLKLGLCLLLVIGMACKDKSTNNDDDDNGDGTGSGDGFATAVQKVWQDESFDDGDEIGIAFDEDDIFLWDYFGDSFDQGDDCYFVDDVGDFVSRDGDVYQLTLFNFFAGGFDTLEVRLTVDGDTLTLDDRTQQVIVKFSDTDDDLDELTPQCTEKRRSTTKELKVLSKVLE